MRYFPQLASGAVCQFPVTKRVSRRTVANEPADGRRVKLADPGAAEVEWQLKLSGLSDGEWQPIETLFEAVEGRLGSFTFLDPLGNLIEWSEGLSAAAWRKDSGVSLTGGVADPLAGFAGTLMANAGGAAAGLEQSADVPGWFRYSLSAWVSSPASTEITLVQRTATKDASKTFSVGAAWKRVQFGVNLGATEELVSFGAKIPAGARVNVFGFQVEAQAGASQYKRTTSGSGVYAAAFFADDVLERKGDGVNNNSCVLRIRARG